MNHQGLAAPGQPQNLFKIIENMSHLSTLRILGIFESSKIKLFMEEIVYRALMSYDVSQHQITTKYFC